MLCSAQEQPIIGQNIFSYQIQIILKLGYKGSNYSWIFRIFANKFASARPQRDAFLRSVGAQALREGLTKNVYIFTKEKAMIANALLYYLIVINVVTFLVYGIDKVKAKRGYWRISEVTLLMLAVIGGSIGALLGMKVWHHKTMHKKFKYGLPLILLAQIALLVYLAQRHEF